MVSTIGYKSHWDCLKHRSWQFVLVVVPVRTGRAIGIGPDGGMGGAKFATSGRKPRRAIPAPGDALPCGQLRAGRHPGLDASRIAACAQGFELLDVHFDNGAGFWFPPALRQGFGVGFLFSPKLDQRPGLGLGFVGTCFFPPGTGKFIDRMLRCAVLCLDRAMATGGLRHHKSRGKALLQPRRTSPGSSATARDWQTPPICRRLLGGSDPGGRQVMGPSCGWHTATGIRGGRQTGLAKKAICRYPMG